MKISLIINGKTDFDYLKEGIKVYEKRIIHYVPFEIEIIPDLKNTKNLTIDDQKIREGLLILSQIKSQDDVVLLDISGKEYKSEEFASFISRKMLSGIKRLVFVIGGPYGFSDEIYSNFKQRISLSKMTFSHQLVRLIFIEQLYRSLTILKGEPYHH